MATGPTFTPADAFPERYGDALQRVLDDEREMRALAARRAFHLIEAQRELVSPVRFDNRLLANRSFRAQIAALLSITEKAAENLIGYSKVLIEAFPATVESLSGGAISWQHALVIVDELGPLEQLARETIERKALAEAPFITPNQLARLVRLERETLHPETIPEKHAEARKTRGVSVDDGHDGMSTLFFTGTSVHIHAIYNRLTVGAKGIDGPRETRTIDQRRADILTHVLLADVDGAQFGVVPDEWDDEHFVSWYRGIKAEVIVSVPVLSLLGHSDEPATIEGRVPIDPETARILAAGADSFIRLLTDPETGTILSVGRNRYKVPADLKRVLEIRDVVCRFPGCVVAAWRTDMDHTHDWQFGGETSLGNLACLCRGHHSLKTAGLWSVSQDDQGVMTWIDPSGRSYTTRPHNPMAA